MRSIGWYLLGCGNADNLARHFIFLSSGRCQDAWLAFPSSSITTKFTGSKDNKFPFSSTWVRHAIGSKMATLQVTFMPINIPMKSFQENQTRDFTKFTRWMDHAKTCPNFLRQAYIQTTDSIKHNRCKLGNLPILCRTDGYWILDAPVVAKPKRL